MQTKSVDSVRSPVSNLQAADPSITHEDFVRAVTAEFWKTFSRSGDEHGEDESKGGKQREAVVVREEEVLKDGKERAEKLKKGMEELKVSRNTAFWSGRCLQY